MLAFVMLFAYFSFSQWLIIWAGNLPEEISWYLQPHSWRLGRDCADHHAVPFRAALCAAAVARAETRRSRLIGLAVLLMFMRLVDIYWYVVPNFADARGHFYFSIWYFIAPIGDWRPVAGVLLLQLAAAAAVAGVRSANCQLVAPRIGTWPLITLRLGRSLRNPAVDYERTDLSARGILLFLAGSAGGRIFIETGDLGNVPLPLEQRGLFAQGQTSPLVQAKKAPTEQMPGAVMQNTPPDQHRRISGAPSASQRLGGYGARSWLPNKRF